MLQSEYGLTEDQVAGKSFHVLHRVPILKNPKKAQAHESIFMISETLNLGVHTREQVQHEKERRHGQLLWASISRAGAPEQVRFSISLGREECASRDIYSWPGIKNEIGFHRGTDGGDPRRYYGRFGKQPYFRFHWIFRKHGVLNGAPFYNLDDVGPRVHY